MSQFSFFFRGDPPLTRPHLWPGQSRNASDAPALRGGGGTIQEAEGALFKRGHYSRAYGMRTVRINRCMRHRYRHMNIASHYSCRHTVPGRVVDLRTSQRLVEVGAPFRDNLETPHGVCLLKKNWTGSPSQLNGWSCEVLSPCDKREMCTPKKKNFTKVQKAFFLIFVECQRAGFFMYVPQLLPRIVTQKVSQILR